MSAIASVIIKDAGQEKHALEAITAPTIYGHQMYVVRAYFLLSP